MFLNFQNALNSATDVDPMSLLFGDGGSVFERFKDAIDERKETARKWISGHTVEKIQKRAAHCLNLDGVEQLRDMLTANDSPTWNRLTAIPQVLLLLIETVAIQVIRGTAYMLSGLLTGHKERLIFGACDLTSAIVQVFMLPYYGYKIIKDPVAARGEIDDAIKHYSPYLVGQNPKDSNEVVSFRREQKQGFSRPSYQIEVNVNRCGHKVRENIAKGIEAIPHLAINAISGVTGMFSHALRGEFKESTGSFCFWTVFSPAQLFFWVDHKVIDQTRSVKVAEVEGAKPNFSETWLGQLIQRIRDRCSKAPVEPLSPHLLDDEETFSGE